jgi:hypothetical protein
LAAVENNVPEVRRLLSVSQRQGYIRRHAASLGLQGGLRASCHRVAAAWSRHRSERPIAEGRLFTGPACGITCKFSRSCWIMEQTLRRRPYHSESHQCILLFARVGNGSNTQYPSLPGSLIFESSLWPQSICTAIGEPIYIGITLEAYPLQFCPVLVLHYFY